MTDFWSNGHFKGFSLCQRDNIPAINFATNLPSQVEDNSRGLVSECLCTLAMSAAYICNVPEQPVLSAMCSNTVAIRAVIYT